jgi:hypothetical protein
VYISIYISKGGTKLTRMQDLQKKVTLKVRLNDKAVAHTTLGKANRNIGVLCVACNIMSYGP